MSYEAIEFLSYFFYGLRWVALVLACILLVLGLDDLFIDLSYWSRFLWRKLSVYRRNARADEDRLFKEPEKPLAILIPAWKEVGIIGEMVQFAANSVDYENYQIFVGTYPNDPDTQGEVDEACRQNSNVHKVVCARPGPTSKADCLNNILDAVLQFEQAAGVRFAGFILHDAEDVISPLELRLFNYLLPAKDLIQIPVYPFPARWNNFTAGHYIDEFAEQHSKDIVVREAMVGQVPSAGVGTCFSRKAMITLLEDNDGIAFDVRSLTEDYEIGMRLADRGMPGIFARYDVRNPRYATTREHRFGSFSRAGNVICVREHFPKTFSEAVRQKSRWVVGIVFQGIRSLGWSRRPLMSYFLWRDRRGGVTNTVGLLVNIVLLIVVTVWIISLLMPDWWQFLSILGDSELLRVLLLINGFLLLNRLLQRFYFVTLYYGVWQGLLSAPRMLWSNVVNFVANLQAVRQVLHKGDPHRVTWDKTTHEFPSIADPRQKPVGRILVEMKAISATHLEAVLESEGRRRIGRELLARDLISSEQLAQALAEQAGLQWSPLDPFSLDPDLVRQLPPTLALRYCVLPIAVEGGTLMLGSERALNPVALAAIGRHLGRKVRYRIVPQGRVTVGLRYWYTEGNPSDIVRMLNLLEQKHDDPSVMESVCRYQVLLGDLIQEEGMLPPAVLAQAMFDFDPISESLGDHLEKKQLISRNTLDRALAEQKRQQFESLRMLEETE